MRPACLLVLVACSGDTSTPVADAPDNAPACTGAAYDNCTLNTQCDSANCHLFEQDGIQVCTQACSGSNPCPADSTGAPVTCNGKGICKPMNNTVCRPE